MGISETEAARLPGKELAGEFLRSKGQDRTAGRALMERAAQRTEEPDLLDRLAAPLKKRDGTLATSPDGEPVEARDYLNDLATPAAIRGMITFVLTNKESPDFPAQQQAMAETFRSFT